MVELVGARTGRLGRRAPARGALWHHGTMAFENVGPQWDRDEPWQTQQVKIMMRGLTDDSPWMRRQRRLLGAALAGLVAVAVLAIVVSAALG